jgi:glycosyltransferase involved in cell wall biosynthesis
MSAPAVTVCIPTYNTARYLPTAVESVLGQDFTDYQLLICDNASTDETPEIGRRYAGGRVRYLRFEEKVTQAGSFNRCLDAAAGEFLTLLHADDHFLPGFLRDRVERLRKSAGAAMAFGAVQLIDAAGDAFAVKRAWERDRELQPPEMLAALLHACLVSPPTLMVRRSCAAAAGPFRTDLTWGHDWEWTMRLAEQGPTLYTATAFAAYREHDQSGTAEVLAAARNAEQERRILDLTFARLREHGAAESALRRSALRALSLRQMFFAESALLAARRSVARYNLRYAAAADPTLLLRPTWWAILVGSTLPVRYYRSYRQVRRRFGRHPLAGEPS